MQKGIKILPASMGSRQRWDDAHLAQTQCGGRYASPQCRQVVLVAMPDFFDQAMSTQALEQPRDLPAGCLQPLSQVFVLETGDVKLPTQQRLEQIQILSGKQVKASQRAFAVSYRHGYFLQVLERRADDRGRW